MQIFTRFSLKNTLVIFMIIAMIVGGGIYSSSSIMTELMPNINFPIITVVTVYPGAAPEDIAESISRPIQKAVSGIQGVTRVNTTSNENISLVMIRFGFSKDMDKAEREIQDAVNKIKVPDKSQKPIISRISYNGIPVVTYSVSGGKDENELSKLIKDKVQPNLTGIKGVGSVNVSGVYDKSIYIKVNESKLKEKGVTLQDVQQALAANDISFPTGTVDITGQTMPVRVSREIANLNDIKSIPIIVLPNTAKIMGDSMGKFGEAITGVYSAVGEMGKGMSEMGKGMGEMGKMVGTNTQAVAMVSGIQKLQSLILSQQAILSNPTSTAADRAKAQETIKVASQQVTQLQSSLDALLSKSMQAANAAGGAGSSSTKLQPGQSSQMNPSQGAVTKNTGAPKNDENTLKITTVALSEVADILEENPEVMSYSRSNSKPTVILSIYKTDDANAVQLANDVESKIKDIQTANSELKINKIYDTSKMITDSINGMLKEGLLGALFAIIVIALFLRDIRATVIAIVSIPLSILIALILLPRFNITLNIMSLSGMAVAVGRIVDDSIVVIENIYRRLQRRKSPNEEIVEDATGEVSSAITSSTITTVAVFLPLGMVGGMVGKIFAPFALTVVICILASLLVAVTVVPLMGKFMLLKRPPKHKEHVSRIEEAYKNILSFALSHKAMVVILSLVLIASSVALVSRVGIQFLPADKTKTISAKLTMPPGTSLKLTDNEVAKFEEHLVNKADVETVTSSVGDTSGSGSFMGALQGTNQANLTIILKEEADPDKALADIKGKAKALENNKAKWLVTPMSNFGTQENLEIVVNGENIDDIKAAADTITGKLKDVKVLSNLTNNLSEKKPEISIKVDSKKAADKGLNPIFVAGIVRSVLNYDKVTTVENNGKSIDVMLGLEKSDLNSVEKVQNLELKGMAGTVLLKDIAEVSVQDGPVSISERDGKRFASISADITAKDTAKVVTEVTDKIKEIESTFKPGVTYTVGGSVDDINESFSQMGMAMLAAIFLVFITMVLAFKEGTAPLAILFSLPFAAVGALFALVITNQPLTMSGLVGLLMLIGIVVTNAIVLIDRVQTNRSKGMEMSEALLEAGAVRLRPIIMTAAATVMALIPLALGFSEGALISKELGVVVIGGLTLSTILTLVIVPVAYSILEGIKDRVMKGKSNEITTAQ
ncbi:MAG: efflux RND transporter permease subunit [Clostridia bacterium]|nr:efflux RND transporter permease subunit [Clostridia bacterium]